MPPHRQLWTGALRHSLCSVCRRRYRPGPPRSHCAIPSALSALIPSPLASGGRQRRRCPSQALHEHERSWWWSDEVAPVPIRGHVRQLLHLRDRPLRALLPDLTSFVAAESSSSQPHAAGAPPLLGDTHRHQRLVADHAALESYVTSSPLVASGVTQRHPTQRVLVASRRRRSRPESLETRSRYRACGCMALTEFSVTGACPPSRFPVRMR